jgi:hypothetical protein
MPPATPHPSRIASAVRCSEIAGVAAAFFWGFAFLQAKPFASGPVNCAPLYVVVAVVATVVSLLTYWEYRGLQYVLFSAGDD